MKKQNTTKSYWFLAILFLAILPAFSQKAATNSDFNTVLNDYYQESIALNPLAATARGDNRFNDQLPNSISKEYLKKIHDFNVKYQKEVSRFSRKSLSAFDKISFDLITLQINQNLEAEKFHLEYMPFDQKSGLPINMPSWGSGKSSQPFKTVQDYENWLKRIDGFVVWSNTAIENFNLGIKTGLVLPKALVVKMIPQLESQTVIDTAKSIFYQPVLNMPTTFSNAEKNKIRQDYTSAIETKIAPTYQKLATYLQQTYLPKARTTSGYDALPNGAAIYQYLVSVFTTTNQTPDQIYKKGLSEVDRITKQILALKDKIGFKGSIDEFYKHALTDPSFFPFTNDDQIIKGYADILPVIQPQLNQLFITVPKTAFEVKAIEKFKAASSSASYSRGSEDGSRPGYFNVPILEASKYNRLGMENLFLHEAIPGHHFQLSLQQENKELPGIRKFASYSVFSEGWALYVESLGEELGLYKDPYQKLAALKSELFRAIRLVTDVGLHSGKMTREQSIDYMMKKGGREEQASISETERYQSNPGQALSYKTGELKISELKARYQKKLGRKFDIRNFHEAILQLGSVPLSVFETYMNDWALEQNKM